MKNGILALVFLVVLPVGAQQIPEKPRDPLTGIVNAHSRALMQHAFLFNALVENAKGKVDVSSVLEEAKEEWAKQMSVEAELRNEGMELRNELGDATKTISDLKSENAALAAKVEELGREKEE